ATSTGTFSYTNTNTGPVAGSLDNIIGTPVPYLFFSNNATAPATISVQSGNVNINPGGYATIGASGSPVSVAINTGADSRTIVPILTTGDMYLIGFTANNTSAGGATNAYQNNGYAVFLVSGANLGLGGSVTSSPVTGGTARNIVVSAKNQILLSANT